MTACGGRLNRAAGADDPGWNGGVWWATNQVLGNLLLLSPD